MEKLIEFLLAFTFLGKGRVARLGFFFCDDFSLVSSVASVNTGTRLHYDKPCWCVKSPELIL